MSGAIAALALIGTGVGLLSIHIDRQTAAEEQAPRRHVHDAADLADTIRRRRGLPI